MHRLRAFLVGLGVTLASGAAVLVVYFVVAWPTSHYRARLYFLLWGAPITLGIPHLLVVWLAGLFACLATGWRSGAAALGSFLGAALLTTALYAGLFSYAVWLHEDDYSTGGAIIRILACGVWVALTLLASRRLRRATGLAGRAV
ncbi:MAG TPA: hypothetical protein VMT29_16270 [Steroidobacteraceae bacterium]|nr:hypothetical protein [Steroidobacteraceae bacterium]